MALSALDKKTALIVIDLQKISVSLPLAPNPIAEVVKNARALLDAFRGYGLPVVLVNVAGRAPGRTEQAPRLGQLPPDWAELIPELDRKPRDLIVTKHTAGAFTRTGLEEALKKRGVTQVVVVGVATSSGVEVTAWQAYEAGFNVTFASDAMTDLNPEAHGYSLAKVFPKIGETGTTREVLDLLTRVADA